MLIKYISVKATVFDFGDQICVENRGSGRGYRTYYKT